MRKPKYLSPTALKMFLTDSRQYYIQYLSDTRVIKEPQTVPMACGSSIDAYCKAYLYSRLIKGNDAKYEFEALFEAQVEPQNRDECKIIGKEGFDLYVRLGAMSDLLLEMSDCVGTPKFEISIESYISKELKGVMLLGKPDIFFRNSQGANVQFDWKWNGAMSASKISPKPGYVKDRPGGKAHKNAFVQRITGINVNVGSKLETVDQDWARQLATYSWLCGQEVGSNTICGIEQICNRDRVASHRAFIGKEFQEATFIEYCNLWEIIESGWIFRDLPESESLEMQKVLDLPVDPALGEFLITKI